MSDNEKLTALERLEELLDERDQELDELRCKVQELEDTSELDWRWARHIEHKEDLSPSLPVPRLEIRWSEMPKDENGYSIQAQYSLVYRHLLGQICFIPLGLTRSSGSLANRTREGVETPFRDGAHLANEMKQLNLRAFAICGNQVEEILICKSCGYSNESHRNGTRSDCDGFR